MAYTGTSIVDYLKSVGQASDYNSRAALAQQKGISNYAGTAEQNTQLLNLLRTVPAPTTPTTTPIPTTTPTPAPTTTSNPTASIPGLTPYLQNQLKNLIPTQPVQQPPQPQQPVQQSVQQPQVNQEDIIKQINEAKAKVADLQAQDEALKKYGVADTEQLSKDESGTYTPTKESSTIQGLIDSISDLTATGATKSLSDIVSEISTAMGLTDVSKQISDLDTQYADDVMEVNDNPWISEGLRSKKISLLQEKYDTKKNALIQQLSSQNETISRAIDYYYKEQDYKKDLLSLQLDAKLKMMDQEIELYKAGQSDLDTSVVETNGRKILINNQTGEIIKDLGAATGETTSNTTTDYKNWLLAGGESGTGKTFSEYLTSGKPATQAQETVAGYASRMEQSETTLKSLQNNIAGMSWVKYKIEDALPSAFQSSEFQQFQQSAKNFINAKLRQESGAAIAESEFKNAQQQYLPQPGDSADTLKLKENNRKLVFENMKQAAGSAYSSVNELLGNNINSDPLGIFD